MSWNDQYKLSYLQSMVNTDLSGSASTKMEGAASASAVFLWAAV